MAIVAMLVLLVGDGGVGIVVIGAGVGGVAGKLANAGDVIVLSPLHTHN